MDEKPTEKQLERIEDMEKHIRDSFEGETRGEASIFIDEHLEEYRIKKELKDEQG